MQRFVLFALFASAVAWESTNKRHAKISEDFKIKYEALRKAEEEAHLAEEMAQAKNIETKATLDKKEADIEIAKDDLRIERAELDDNQRVVKEVAADKAHATAVEKQAETKIEEAKNEEAKVEDATMKVEAQFNQTLAAEGANSGDTLATKGSSGAAVVLFMVMGGIGSFVFFTMRNQKALDDMCRATDPISAGMSKSDFDNGLEGSLVQNEYASAPAGESMGGAAREEYSQMA